MLISKFINLYKMISTTAKRWFSDDPFTLSASVSYYAVFSLPGLLIMIMAVGSIAFEKQEIEQALLQHVTDIMGENVADSVGTILKETRQDNRNFWAFVVGGLTLAFGATGLFAQLQKALNVIWDVEFKDTRGIGKFMLNRLISFGMVVTLGFLLLISLVATAMLSVLNGWLSVNLPSYFIYIIHSFNLFTSFTFCLFIFSMIFKILPDTKIMWRSAFAGGVVSTVLFMLGEYAIKMYFETAEPQSTFGAAGSIILLMLWASYSCLLLLFGAQFSRTYEENYLKNAELNANAPHR